MATEHAPDGFWLELGPALGTGAPGWPWSRPSLVVEIGASVTAEHFTGIGRGEALAAPLAGYLALRVLVQVPVVRRPTDRGAVYLVVNALGLGGQLFAAPFAERGGFKEAKRLLH